LQKDFIDKEKILHIPAKQLRGHGYVVGYRLLRSNYKSDTIQAMLPLEEH